MLLQASMYLRHCACVKILPIFPFCSSSFPPLLRALDVSDFEHSKVVRLV
ncbi:unnamed protein product [Larinioides sclopetarius]|uniref:Uncharacterized protein n=1 Tax=Larinioides sclopetarius TaxID=280406 RepID=A0AAV2BSW2_9ARAC